MSGSFLVLGIVLVLGVSGKVKLNGGNINSWRSGDYAVLYDSLPTREGYRFAIKSFICSRNETLLLFNDQPWRNEIVNDLGTLFNVSFSKTKAGRDAYMIGFPYTVNLTGVYEISYATLTPKRGYAPEYNFEVDIFPSEGVTIDVARLEKASIDQIDCAIPEEIPYGLVQIFRNEASYPVVELEYDRTKTFWRKGAYEAIATVTAGSSAFRFRVPYGHRPVRYRCLIEPYWCRRGYGMRSRVIEVRSSSVPVFLESIEKYLFDDSRIRDIPITEDVATICCETESLDVSQVTWTRADTCGQPATIILDESNVPVPKKWMQTGNTFFVTYETYRRYRYSKEGYVNFQAQARSCLKTKHPRLPPGQYECIFGVFYSTTRRNGVTITDVLEISTAESLSYGSATWIECRLPSWREGELYIRRSFDGAVVSRVRLTTPDETQRIMTESNSCLKINGSVVTYRFMIEKLSRQKDNGYQCVFTDLCTTAFSKIQYVSPKSAVKRDMCLDMSILYIALFFIVTAMGTCSIFRMRHNK